jgi:hypothetical protein
MGFFFGKRRSLDQRKNENGMGKKQLLLILCTLVLVGGAIVAATSLFHAKAVEANRNALTNDLEYFAAKAREFYWRPSVLGGGNRSFAEATSSKISMASSNSNGRFFIVGSPTKDEIVIRGVGKVGMGKDSTQVQVIVNEQYTTFQILH